VWRTCATQLTLELPGPTKDKAIQAKDKRKNTLWVTLRLR
jgi:hypothetical protein